MFNLQVQQTLEWSSNEMFELLGARVMDAHLLTLHTHIVKRRSNSRLQCICNGVAEKEQGQTIRQ